MSSFELLPGFHTVRFVYSKDNLYKRGQDRAFIALVDVYGMSTYVTCPSQSEKM
jgi:hypothetical protein